MTKTNDSYILSKRGFWKGVGIGVAGLIVEHLAFTMLVFFWTGVHEVWDAPKQIKTAHSRIDSLRHDLTATNSRVDTIATAQRAEFRQGRTWH
ncbi:MAG: hypothetical protein JSS75_07145 [Bacteroidetes bacterium]|nr:hypothetical protein [Bacteroidota bacterium]